MARRCRDVVGRCPISPRVSAASAAERHRPSAVALGTLNHPSFGLQTCKTFFLSESSAPYPCLSVFICGSGRCRKRPVHVSVNGPFVMQNRRLPTLAVCGHYHRRNGFNFRVRNGNGCGPAAMGRRKNFLTTETRRARRENRRRNPPLCPPCLRGEADCE